MPRQLADWPYPRLAAHRGAGKAAPENTLAAMRRGYDAGYRMVEFDAKLSADGVPILLHDDRVDRTTHGRGAAARLSWTALAELDAGRWHSARYAGEPIPRLSAIARWAIANRVACNVEIKPCRGRDALTGAEVARAAARDWRDGALAPLLSSFSVPALESARQAAPALPRALLADRLPRDWQALVDRLGCIGLSLNHRWLSEAKTIMIKQAGLRLMVYTCNHPRRVRRLLDWGVDTVITDAIDSCAPLLRSG